MNHASRAYARIAGAIDYLAAHRHEQPSLAELGAHVGLSEFHLQREFKHWAGVSPKQFLAYLTKQEAKRRLREETVMDAALSCGLSGPGRLHDLMISCEGVTPGQYRSRGQGLEIRYGLHAVPFGHCLLAVTERGICKLAFFDDDAEAGAIAHELQSDWAAARVMRDDSATRDLVATIFGDGPGRPLRLLLRGSPFQLRVWEALLSIPEGRLVSYQGVARCIDRPTSVRAVASAIAKNDIAYLIPCHRVIRKSGDFSHYRWGSERKRAMIGWEAARVQAAGA